MPQNKEILAYQVPPPKPGQVADDNCFSLLFGMKAEEAKRRYVLQLDRPEDPYYYYINILPRFRGRRRRTSSAPAGAEQRQLHAAPALV